MVVVGRLALASVLAFALVVAEPPASSSDAEEAARLAGDLDADDECASPSTASGDESCAVSALQRRAAASRLGGEAAPIASESTTAAPGAMDADVQPVLIPGSKAAQQEAADYVVDIPEDTIGEPSEEVARELEALDNSSNDSSDEDNSTTSPVPESDGEVHFSSCLCVFGIDRTLTAAQGHADECEGSKPQHGIQDPALGGGGLLLSQLGGAGLKGTFCENCQVGLATGSKVTGSMERMVISDFLSSSKAFSSTMESLKMVAFTLPWESLESANAKASGENLSAPIVIDASNKPLAVGRILDWYGKQGIHIKADYAYFFDDRKDEVEAFAKTSINARQVSCGSRDAAYNGSVGFCGATTDELQMEVGIYTCDDLGLKEEAHLVKADNATGEEKAKSKGTKPATKKK